MSGAGVFERHVEAFVGDLGLNPGPVFGTVARVDHKHVAVFRKSVHQQVVHDAPAAVGHAAVLDFAIKQGAGVVAGHPLDQGQSVWSRHEKLAHVAHVEHADAVAHGVVLFLQPGVLHGHVETGEGNHLSSCRKVRVVEGGEFKWGCLHGAKVMRRLPARGGTPRRGWTVLRQSPTCLQRPGDKPRWTRCATVLFGANPCPAPP